MNSEEAKLILSCIHERPADPGGDLELQQALELLDTDSALASWYEQERAFDDAVSGKLTQVEPPADLKASLVALLGETDAESSSSDEPTAHDKITWFRRPQFLAAAAAVILLPIIVLQFMGGKANANSYETFRSDMVGLANSPLVLDHEHTDLKDIYEWLESKSATCPIDQLPQCADSTKAVGCKIIDWGEEKTVTLICFKNDEEQVVHCFVVPRELLKDLPGEDQIRKPLTLSNLETCGWTDEKFVYLLIGSAKGVHVSAPAQ